VIPEHVTGCATGFPLCWGSASAPCWPGATSSTAIAEWAQDLTPAVRLRLGLGRATPCESTIRRVLQRVDAEALDTLVSTWLAARPAPRQPLPVIAVDGKSARGARSGQGRAVHLLAAFDTTSPRVSRDLAEHAW
jgi:hypothetical protein